MQFLLGGLFCLLLFFRLLCMLSDCDGYAVDAGMKALLFSSFIFMRAFVTCIASVPERAKGFSPVGRAKIQARAQNRRRRGTGTLATQASVFDALIHWVILQESNVNVNDSLNSRLAWI